ncbi:MAG: hypothetical protein AB7Y46_08860 [Armatimonadota bacterium]
MQHVLDVHVAHEGHAVAHDGLGGGDGGGGVLERVRQTVRLAA